MCKLRASACKILVETRLWMCVYEMWKTSVVTLSQKRGSSMPPGEHYEKSSLKNFAKFTGIPASAPQTCKFIKKDNPTQAFSCNFEKFSRTVFHQATASVMHCKISGWENALAPLSYVNICFCNFLYMERNELLNLPYFLFMEEESRCLKISFFQLNFSIFNGLLLHAASHKTWQIRLSIT